MLTDNIFTFNGTLRRLYWWPIYIITNVLGFKLLGQLEHVSSSGSHTMLLFFGLCVLCEIQLATTAKRLREAGFSPYLCLLFLVPLLGAFAIFILAGCLPPSYKSHNV